MQKIHALIIMVMWAGCGGEVDEEPTWDSYDPCVPTAVVVQAPANLDQVEGVRDALALWRAVDGPNLIMDDASERIRLPVSFERAALVFRGLYRRHHADILINDAITDRKALAIVVAHEIGHAFGLSHDNSRPSVMNRGNTTEAPNAFDAAAVFAHRSTPCGVVDP